MRKAELSVASAFALLSIFLMWKSTELPIGWERGVGPGGGAFPFWLSLLMLIMSIAIFVRGWRYATPQSRSTERFVDRDALSHVAVAAAAIFGMLLMAEYLGAYVAICLFFLFMLRIVGHRSWRETLAIAFLSPVGLFFFFEIGMKIFLPKGITEPLFYPLYAIFL